MDYNKNSLLQFLKQPISETACQSLTEDLINNGCHNPLLIWDNYIIDGCKRYDICRTWQLPYTVEYLPFTDMNDAVSYVCEAELNRPDLTCEMRRYLVGKKLKTDTEISIRKSARTSHISSPTASLKALKKQEMARALGEKYHLSPGTVLKYARFMKNIDLISNADKSFALRILSSELRISLEHTAKLARFTASELRTLDKILSKSNRYHIGYSEIYQITQRNSSDTGKSKTKTRKEIIPLIRNIPKYDPDAEVASLTLTIPSWISSIERMEKNAELDKISLSAGQKLKKQLSCLMTVSGKLYKILEDLHYENN